LEIESEIINLNISFNNSELLAAQVKAMWSKLKVRSVELD